MAKSLSEAGQEFDKRKMYKDLMATFAEDAASPDRDIKLPQF